MGWKSSALFLVLSIAASGCRDACQTLAEQICECEATLTLRNQCIQEVSALAAARSRSAKSHQQISAENNRCLQLQKTCNCDNLEQGKLSLCGLSLE